MARSFSTNILTCLFIVLCNFEDSKARSITDDETKAIEESFFRMTADQPLTKATFENYEDKFTTICWNEKVTIHFLNNGTTYGYAEYSVSLELNPSLGESLSGETAPTEPYEVTDVGETNPRVLSFVTFEKNDQETIKQNLTTKCRSDKGFSKTFIDSSTKKKVEIKLKPVVQEVNVENNQLVARILGDETAEQTNETDTNTNQSQEVNPSVSHEPNSVVNSEAETPPNQSQIQEVNSSVSPDSSQVETSSNQSIQAEVVKPAVNQLSNSSDNLQVVAQTNPQSPEIKDDRVPDSNKTRKIFDYIGDFFRPLFSIFFSSYGSGPNFKSLSQGETKDSKAIDKDIEQPTYMIELVKKVLNNIVNFTKGSFKKSKAEPKGQRQEEIQEVKFRSFNEGEDSAENQEGKKEQLGKVHWTFIDDLNDIVNNLENICGQVKKVYNARNKLFKASRNQQIFQSFNNRRRYGEYDGEQQLKLRFQLFNDNKNIANTGQNIYGQVKRHYGARNKLFKASNRNQRIFQSSNNKRRYGEYGGKQQLKLRFQLFNDNKNIANTGQNIYGQVKRHYGARNKLFKASNRNQRIFQSSNNKRRYGEYGGKQQLKLRFKLFNGNKNIANTGQNIYGQVKRHYGARNKLFKASNRNQPIFKSSNNRRRYGEYGGKQQLKLRFQLFNDNKNIVNTGQNIYGQVKRLNGTYNKLRKTGKKRKQFSWGIFNGAKNYVKNKFGAYNIKRKVFTSNTDRNQQSQSRSLNEPKGQRQVGIQEVKFSSFSKGEDFTENPEGKEEQLVKLHGTFIDGLHDIPNNLENIHGQVKRLHNVRNKLFKASNRNQATFQSSNNRRGYGEYDGEQQLKLRFQLFNDNKNIANTGQNIYGQVKILNDTYNELRKQQPFNKVEEAEEKQKQSRWGIFGGVKNYVKNKLGAYNIKRKVFTSNTDGNQQSQSRSLNEPKGQWQEEIQEVKFSSFNKDEDSAENQEENGEQLVKLYWTYIDDFHDIVTNLENICSQVKILINTYNELRKQQPVNKVEEPEKKQKKSGWGIFSSVKNYVKKKLGVYNTSSTDGNQQSQSQSLNEPKGQRQEGIQEAKFSLFNKGEDSAENQEGKEEQLVKLYWTFIDDLNDIVNNLESICGQVKRLYDTRNKLFKAFNRNQATFQSSNNGRRYGEYDGEQKLKLRFQLFNDNKNIANTGQNIYGQVKILNDTHNEEKPEKKQKQSGWGIFSRVKSYVKNKLGYNTSNTDDNQQPQFRSLNEENQEKEEEEKAKIALLDDSIHSEQGVGGERKTEGKPKISPFFKHILDYIKAKNVNSFSAFIKSLFKHIIAAIFNKEKPQAQPPIGGEQQPQQEGKQQLQPQVGDQLPQQQAGAQQPTQVEGQQQQTEEQQPQFRLYHAEPEEEQAKFRWFADDVLSGTGINNNANLQPQTGQETQQQQAEGEQQQEVEQQDEPQARDQQLQQPPQQTEEQQPQFRSYNAEPEEEEAKFQWFADDVLSGTGINNNANLQPQTGQETQQTAEGEQQQETEQQDKPQASDQQLQQPPQQTEEQQPQFRSYNAEPEEEEAKFQWFADDVLSGTGINNKANLQPQTAQETQQQAEEEQQQEVEQQDEPQEKDQQLQQPPQQTEEQQPQFRSYNAEPEEEQAKFQWFADDVLSGTGINNKANLQPQTGQETQQQAEGEQQQEVEQQDEPQAKDQQLQQPPQQTEKQQPQFRSYNAEAGEGQGEEHSKFQWFVDNTLSEKKNKLQIEEAPSETATNQVQEGKQQSNSKEVAGVNQDKLEEHRPLQKPNGDKDSDKQVTEEEEDKPKFRLFNEENGVKNENTSDDYDLDEGEQDIEPDNDDDDTDSDTVSTRKLDGGKDYSSDDNSAHDSANYDSDKQTFGIGKDGKFFVGTSESLKPIQEDTHVSLRKLEVDGDGDTGKPQLSQLSCSEDSEATVLKNNPDISKYFPTLYRKSPDSADDKHTFRIGEDGDTGKPQLPQRRCSELEDSKIIVPKDDPDYLKYFPVLYRTSPDSESQSFRIGEDGTYFVEPSTGFNTEPAQVSQRRFLGDYDSPNSDANILNYAPVEYGVNLESESNMFRK